MTIPNPIRSTTMMLNKISNGRLRMRWKLRIGEFRRIRKRKEYGMSSTIFVTPELTPNPEAMRFSVSVDLVDTGPHEFTSAVAASTSPLAKKLFLFPWVTGVMIGRNFVTVTKQPGLDWLILQDGVVEFIRRHLEGGEPTVLPLRHDGTSTAPVDTSPIARRIREIIDTEIRPAVARDGGDIVFEGFQDGIVRLYLRGACSGCPSSLMTLKMGIETRLKAELPEVEEVVAI